MTREELSKKVQERLRALHLPSEYYCKKCDFPVIDEKTAGMIEGKYGGYYDICQCDKPETYDEE